MRDCGLLAQVEKSTAKNKYIFNTAGVVDVVVVVDVVDVVVLLVVGVLIGVEVSVSEVEILVVIVVVIPAMVVMDDVGPKAAVV